MGRAEPGSHWEWEGGRLGHVPPSSHLPRHTSTAGNSSGVSQASRNDALGFSFSIFQTLYYFSV